ncbi:inter-alpha-trypsin inhibitor heavy chain H4-like [Saccostrea echinata]|uniref:inter-alpha-trypsin inhibitor heavy chain H4-like n=1 Tax=Saccostrea echinata TaxID=191078 RepID=UPI002A7EE430|nr:inter-alpha-trypsin inhibitor heavy chain H4-like [Saccostrea echinata]
MYKGFIAYGIFLLCLVSSQNLKKPEIYYLHVTSEIDFRFAKTVVTSKVVNKEPVAREAVFDLTLPNEAFITAFKLIINGKEIHGKVKEKEQAKQEFEAAKAKGQSAGHIVAKPRETNKFQIQVNVAAQEKVTFELTYRELLRRTKGLYNHVIYINPGQVVDDLKINVLIKESRNITTIKTPPIKNDLLTEGPEGTNQLAVVDRISPTKAFISYEPSRAEQESGISGQFIVQYDVDRSDNAGDILVMDGYFVHFLAPEGIEPMPMDIVFVLDKSGSMSGTKMRQLQKSMYKIIDDVKSEDKIMIIAFDSSLSYWKPEFVQATASNKNAAKDYIKKTPARGGTNIDLSLREGLQKLMQISGTKGRAPLMVFLTDGQATSGETRTERILENVKKQNEAELPIFSLAFGKGADFDIVKRLAAQNNGFARKIYEDADAALQIAGFYEEISTVLLKNVSFNYVDGTLYDTSVTETNFNTYFKGSEMVVAGKIKDLTKLQSGMIVNGEGSKTKVFLRVPPNHSIIIPWPRPPFPPFPPRPRPFPTPSPPVTTRNPGMMEKLWAYLSIKQMLRDKDALDSPTEIKKLEDKILQLSLKYQFVTPLTSMVVTLPDNTKANPSEVKPTESNQADSLSMGRAAAPGFLANNMLSSSRRISSPRRGGGGGGGSLFQKSSSFLSFAAPPRRKSMLNSASNARPFFGISRRMPFGNIASSSIQSLPSFPGLTRGRLSTTTTPKPVTPSIPKPRTLEKSQVPSFGIVIPGLAKPLCFDLPMSSSTMYSILKLTSSVTDYRIDGQFGTEMINKITVKDGRVVTFNANRRDITKAPIYRKNIDGVTVKAMNTPLGLQLSAEFIAPKDNLDGILSIFKDYSGKLVDIMMESGEFVSYVNLEQTNGQQTSLRAITKEFGDGVCWYLDNETIKRFYTNMSQFEVMSV